MIDFFKPKIKNPDAFGIFYFYTQPFLSTSILKKKRVLKRKIEKNEKVSIFGFDAPFICVLRHQ
tara:strand:+ start:32699 stop:32890 length:192 start_codon:yes stop_codon:yes gene_type:complete